jgi:uncharacterized protein YjbJ (UPF0337 family)
MSDTLGASLRHVSEGTFDMIDQQALKGHWDEVKANLRERWDSLTSADLPNFNGDLEQLVARIQTKTGESRDAIENFLAEATSGDGQNAVAEALNSARQTASEVADRAVETARDAYGQVADSLRERLDDSQKMIRDQPAMSVGMAFGAGMVTGVLLFLMMRPRS